MPPVIRLIQADDLDGWQRVLLALCLPSDSAQSLEPPVVVVPSRAAAEQWRRTLEQRLLVERWTAPVALQDALEHRLPPGAHDALIVPHLWTREQLYDAWHDRARIEKARLPLVTREVLMGASARHAARVHRPPFLLRPGLVAAMLRFHDQIERLAHEPAAWLQDAAARLEDEAATDRGAARLLLQTRFLQESFRTYAARVAEADGIDERGLRLALRRSPRQWSPPHVVLSVADHHADADGMWPADLQVLGESPGLARIDVVATRAIADGLFQRLRTLWPVAAEVRVPPQRPALTRLEVASTERRWIACRDRDEEVLSYARRVKTLRPADVATTALVYRRPLPYLYAAQFLFGAAGIPYQSSGSLPLAAEPWAAGLDLLMDAALSGFTRTALVTVLRSPHVLVRHADGTPVSPADIAALDGWLARQRYLGTLEHFDLLRARPAAAPPQGGDGATGRYADEWRQERAARSVAAAVRPWLDLLVPLQGTGPGAGHVRALRAAWDACQRLPLDDDPEASRTRRTRAALDLLLDRLEGALAAHDPAPVPARDTCILIRRWIEEGTFALPRDEEGVHLVDAGAAPYGLFDHARIVGLIEGEWPAPTAREIFYPAFMLERLGWAEERTRTAALRASFADLLTLPAVTVGRLGARARSGRGRPALVAARPAAGLRRRSARRDTERRAPAGRHWRRCGAGDAGGALGRGPGRGGARLGCVASLPADGGRGRADGTGRGRALQRHGGGDVHAVPVPVLRGAGARAEGRARRGTGSACP